MTSKAEGAQKRKRASKKDSSKKCAEKKAKKETKLALPNPIPKVGDVFTWAWSGGSCHSTYGCKVIAVNKKGTEMVVIPYQQEEKTEKTDKESSSSSEEEETKEATREVWKWRSYRGANTDKYGGKWTKKQDKLSSCYYSITWGRAKSHRMFIAELKK